MSLTPMNRPEGQSTKYRFFKHVESGRNFKVMTESVKAPPVNPDAGFASTQPVIVVGVSPVDAQGKALTDQVGNPVVDVIHHTITADELATGELDVAKIVERLTEGRILLINHRLIAEEALKSFTAQWQGSAPTV